MFHVALSNPLLCLFLLKSYAMVPKSSSSEYLLWVTPKSGSLAMVRLRPLTALVVTRSASSM